MSKKFMDEKRDKSSLFFLLILCFSILVLVSVGFSLLEKKQSIGTPQEEIEKSLNAYELSSYSGYCSIEEEKARKLTTITYINYQLKKMKGGNS